MKHTEKINENIYRITMPYKDIYTTVYIIKTPSGVLIFDAASYNTDITDAVMPYLDELGIPDQNVKYILISHNHPDHSGGLNALAEAIPTACVVSASPVLKISFGERTFLAPDDGTVILDVLRVVAIPGHTLDSIAVFDKRTNTLVSGDCLQAHGICGSGLWAANVRFPAEYKRAISDLRHMGIEEICAAHDYYPFGYRMCGGAEVNAYLDACIEPLDKLRKLALDNPALSDDEVAGLYNSDPALPKIGGHVVNAVRELANGVYTAEMLKTDLRNIGIREGDMVLMHSSYRSLGQLKGGAEAFFRAFAELLGDEGTLVVPALSFDSVTADNPVFDKYNTPSCVGYLSEYFRTNVRGVERSMHATHSCCALGKYAKEITAKHILDTTPVGANSPFALLREYGGKVLMLGCGTRCNTSMHGVEELTEPPYCIDRTNTVKYILKDGESVTEQTAYRHDFATETGEHFVQRYDRLIPLLGLDEVRHSYILSAESYLIDANAMWQKGHEALKQDPMFFVDYPTSTNG